MKEHKEDNYGNKPDPTAKRDQGMHPNQEGRNETGSSDPKTGHGNSATGYTGERVTDYEDDASETRFKNEGIEYVDSKVRTEEESTGIQQSINPESQSLGEATGNSSADGLEQKPGQKLQ